MSEAWENFALDCLGRQLAVAARRVRALYDARLAEAGATFAHWVTLGVLVERSGLVQRELASLLDVEGPTMVRRIDHLEAEGLVERVPMVNDRRSTRVEITEHGREVYERLRPVVEQSESELREELSSEDLQTTHQVLRHLIERARTIEQASPASRS